MRTDPTKTSGRVVEKRYRDLPIGHRTTLVVGMMDMFNLLTGYLDPAFEPIAGYASSYESGDLRELLDDYLSADHAEDKNCAIASSFLSMLIQKSGHGLKPRSFLFRLFRGLQRHTSKVRHHPMVGKPDPEWCKKAASVAVDELVYHKILTPDHAEVAQACIEQQLFVLLVTGIRPRSAEVD